MGGRAENCLEVEGKHASSQAPENPTPVRNDPESIDDGMHAFEALHDRDLELDSMTSKRLRRKIDFLILPVRNGSEAMLK